MAYQRLLNPRTIMVFMLAGLLAIAVSCGGAADPTAESGAQAPTVAATVQPAATPAPAATTAPASTAATPVAQVQPTNTPDSPAMTDGQPEGILNVGYKELGLFGTSPKLTPGQVMLFVGSTVGEQLLYRDVEGNYLPKLVEEWSVSDDSLVWTMKLQEGVQFHHGYGEMTADDVIWTMQNYGAEGSISPRASHLRRLWSNPEGWVQAVDDHTIELHTGELHFDMLLWMSVPYAGNIVSKKQVDELGEEAASSEGAGTGPWEMVEVRPQESWEMRAVEEHWRKSPNFEELVLHEIQEESTRLANFQTGNLDVFNVVGLDSLPTVQAMPDVKFMRVEGGATEHLGIFGAFYVGLGTEDQRPGYDPSLPWVSSNPDPSSEEWAKATKVRQAMAISIDRQLIVDELLHGEGKPLVLWGWESQIDRLPPEYRQWEYDPEKAARLLEEAGYPGGGFEITLTPSIRGVPAEVEACEAVATMWEAIGIEVKVQKIPYASLSPQIRTRDYQGANCHGTGGRSDPLSLLLVLTTLHASFTVGFEHPYMEERIEKALHIVDTDERYKIMVDVAKFSYDNVVEMGLYSVNQIWPLGPRIDPWQEHFEYGDKRVLTGLEFAPHRQ
jgi:peptide/nickel transport system substrate-binding protein